MTIEQYTKEKSIGFNRWLFDNKLAPNSSFLWFRYDYSRDDVRFYKIEQLYEAYISDIHFSQFEKAVALNNQLSFQILKELTK